MNFKNLFDQYLTLINRLVPKPAALPVVGIDIGASFVKAVEVETLAGKMEIRRWAIEPIAGDDSKSALKKIVERHAFE